MNTRRLFAGARRASIVHGAGALVLVGILAGGYTLGVAPVDTIRARQQSLRTALKARSTEESDLRRRHREAEAACRVAEESLRTSGVTLRPATQLNSQIRDIAALASEMKVEVDSLNASPPVSDPQFTRIPVRLAGRATARSVAEFMAAVRTRFADVTVRTFELRADLTPEATGSSVVMEIEWYAAKSE